MSEINVIAASKNDDDISINSTISQSYLYFMSHFSYFMKLAAVPMFIWIFADLLCEILFREYNLRYDPIIPRSIASASFALIWYRQFLLGSKYATYSQLFDRILSSGHFSIFKLLKSLIRIIITSIVIFIPTLILSISYMLYQYSQGVLINNAVIQNIAFKSTTLVFLMFSPILVRLSLYTVSIALGRQSLSISEVWKKTSGNTWILWVLTFRALLPISLYSYALNWGFGKIAGQFSLNYIWANLLINIPAGFLTFMMLAIVVAANAEAFKVIFGLRSKSREQ